MHYFNAEAEAFSPFQKKNEFLRIWVGTYEENITTADVLFLEIQNYNIFETTPQKPR